MRSFEMTGHGTKSPLDQHGYYELFPPDFVPLAHGFEGRSSATHFTLMRALVVVEVQPVIEICLQRFDGLKDLFAERDLMELLQDRLVKALADAVRLR